MTTERNKVLVDASASFKDRYQAMQNYERAVVKNLKPMIGPYGDNETAAQFINGAIKRRTELFGSDVTRNAASASELLDRAMAYRPPTPQQPAVGPGKVQRFIGRANEAIGVARDLVDLAVGGAKKSVDMDSVHSGAANLVRPGGRTGIKEIDASLRSVPVVVNGKIDEGGRVRPMTEADRRDLKSFKDQIGLRQNNKGGDAPRRSNMSNFLATDEVPESLFGIPIVASPEQYTESDIAFFEEHPRAGGFYELGDEDTDTQAATGAEGTSEELPRYYKVQPGDNLAKIARATGVSSANIAKYSKLADPNKIHPGQMLSLTEPYPGKWNNPGNVQWSNKVAYEGETGRVKSNISSGYFLTFDTPQNGLNAKAQVIGQNVRVKIPEQYREGKIPSDKFTVENLINVYAPPKDKNDTPGYIKFVADELGVDKDAVLNIDDAKQMASLLRAIATRDSKPEYAKWYRDSEYAEAVKKMKIPAKDREKTGKKGK